jgi:hypothetical protein
MLWPGDGRSFQEFFTERRFDVSDKLSQNRSSCDYRLRRRSRNCLGRGGDSRSRRGHGSGPGLRQEAIAQRGLEVGNEFF